MSVVFDLDDTLYLEEEYILGGLKAAAKVLALHLKQKESAVKEALLQLYQQDRFYIFDRYLKERGIASKTLVKECIKAYRAHTPHLHLFPEATTLLEELQNIFPVYVVTDGNVFVQESKIKALELKKWCKKCFVTNRYGRDKNKPSPYCFLKICQREDLQPKQVVYIADNPRKDFCGIKPLGFHTIRIKKGRYAHELADSAYEAEYVFESLTQIDVSFLKKLLL